MRSARTLFTVSLALSLAAVALSARALALFILSVETGLPHEDLAAVLTVTNPGGDHWRTHMPTSNFLFNAEPSWDTTGTLCTDPERTTDGNNKTVAQ